MVYENITCEHIQVFVMRTAPRGKHKSNFSYFLISTSDYIELV